MGMPSLETIFLTVTLGIWVREIGAIMPFTGTPKWALLDPFWHPLDPLVYWWHVHIPWCLFIEGMGIPAYHTVSVLLVGIGTPPKTCHFVTWSSRDERIHYYCISWCNELYRVLQVLGVSLMAAYAPLEVCTISPSIPYSTYHVQVLISSIECVCHDTKTHVSRHLNTWFARMIIYSI